MTIKLSPSTLLRISPVELQELCAVSHITDTVPVQKQKLQEETPIPSQQAKSQKAKGKWTCSMWPCGK
jgi:hypothetical protein